MTLMKRNCITVMAESLIKVSASGSFFSPLCHRNSKFKDHNTIQLDKFIPTMQENEQRLLESATPKMQARNRMILIYVVSSRVPVFSFRLSKLDGGVADVSISKSKIHMVLQLFLRSSIWVSRLQVIQFIVHMFLFIGIIRNVQLVTSVYNLLLLVGSITFM